MEKCETPLPWQKDCRSGGSRKNRHHQRSQCHLTAVCNGAGAKYFAQVYQALRIEVNDEMNSLIDFFTEGRDLLKPGGRFAVITYHSLEDRLVKTFLKQVM